ncbi:coiled-coil domain-containing protein 172 isoform X2 [Polypterus senegalus]|uniref:coiled-coil domain-containing protein 172 isoform X2 n=1 Tax=Polypterus senegalus TaxID=55291 RepID=UPI0019624A0E|nr:coiled-coil domain-containing protein 172 isoform X2 [Polypterus senegalus]
MRGINFPAPYEHVSATRVLFIQFCKMHSLHNPGKSEISTSLDAAFHHILLSEQHASDKMRLLKEVNVEVNQKQSKVKLLTEELNCAKIHHTNKLKDLTGLSMQLKLLKKKEEGVQQQKEELLHQKNCLLQAAGQKKNETTEERKKFLKEITDFNCEYNLLSNRAMAAESQAKAEIQSLAKEAEDVSKDIEYMKQNDLRLNSIKQQLRILREQLEGLENKTEALRVKLSKAKISTKCLNAEKFKIEQKPQNDPEILGLKKELETFIGEDGNNNTYEVLLSEIHFLQMNI